MLFHNALTLLSLIATGSAMFVAPHSPAAESSLFKRSQRNEGHRHKSKSTYDTSDKYTEYDGHSAGNNHRYNDDNSAGYHEGNGDYDHHAGEYDNNGHKGYADDGYSGSERNGRDSAGYEGTHHSNDNEYSTDHHGENYRHKDDYDSLPESHSYSLSVEYEESEQDHNKDAKPNSIEEVTLDQVIKPAEDDQTNDTSPATPPPSQPAASAPTPTEAPCSRAIDLKLKLLGDSTVTACAL
ncbi:hypothetical protein K7432_006701 [Basidiobolus ranarum]|uniref:Uncharacterized protein n=1 Tax=Basidiobolus ranarum TaxID=34480 RepID=A0ABR2W188_9FUNG